MSGKSIDAKGIRQEARRLVNKIKFKGNKGIFGTVLYGYKKDGTPHYIDLDNGKISDEAKDVIRAVAEGGDKLYAKVKTWWGRTKGMAQSASAFPNDLKAFSMLLEFIKPSPIAFHFQNAFNTAVAPFGAQVAADDPQTTALKEILTLGEAAADTGLGVKFAKKPPILGKGAGTGTKFVAPPKTVSRETPYWPGALLGAEIDQGGMGPYLHGFGHGGYGGYGYS